MWKAVEKGWQASDLKRVKKKLYTLYDDFGGSIEFKTIEELALMLDEPVDYKLEWSLIRLCKDNIIDVFNKNNNIYIDILPQQPEGRYRHIWRKEMIRRRKITMQNIPYNSAQNIINISEQLGITIPESQVC